MAITFVGETSGENTSPNTSTTATIPAAVATNDLLIAFVNVAVTSTGISPASGWTQIDSVVSTQSMSTALFYKLAVPGDADTPTTFTRSASGKAAMQIVAFRGVDTSSPIAASAVQPYQNVTATTRAASAAASSDFAVQLAATKASPVGTWAAPTGFSTVSERYQAGSGAAASAVATSSTALAGSDVWTHSVSTPQAIIWTLSFTPGDDEPASPVPGTVTYLWTGGQTDTTAIVKSKLAGATSVRLAYSTDPAMASPTYVSAQVPDGSGRVTHTLSGLSPNTRYYVQLADTPSDGDESLIGVIGQIKTHQTQGVPIASTKVLLGGCVRTGGPNPAALVDAADWNADFGIFNGDFTYSGTESPDPAQHSLRLDNQLAAVPALRNLVAIGGVSRYVVSDHDCGVVDNGDSNNVWTAANIEAYKQVVPHGILLDQSATTKSRDQQWDHGRISFFQVDVRTTDRSPGAMTDGPSKTLLGADQLGRLLDWLGTTTQPFCVIISDPAWMGSDDTTPVKADWWPAYPTERTTVANAINAAQARGIHVEMWHGDSHLIGYATAAKNTWGNFPVICAAPFDNTGGGRNTSTFTAFYNNSPSDVRLYGRITFTDDGTTITRSFSGWDQAAGIERVSHIQTVEATMPVPSQRWWRQTDSGLDEVTPRRIP